MKSIKFIALTFVACLTLFIGTSNEKASAEENDSNNVIHQLEFYDENGNQIFPYSEEELDQFAEKAEIQSKVSLFSRLVYNSQPFSFTFNIWLGSGYNGRAFYNPDYMLLTPDGLVAEAFDFIMYNDTGSGAGTEAGRISAPKGWTGATSFPLSHLDRGKSYRFEFRNANTSGVKNNFKNAALYYN